MYFTVEQLEKGNVDRLNDPQASECLQEICDMLHAALTGTEYLVEGCIDDPKDKVTLQCIREDIRQALSLYGQMIRG